MNKADDIPDATGGSPESLECGAFDLLGGMSASEQASVLRSIVNELPDAVVVHKTDGEILFFNSGMCRLLGYTYPEMLELDPFGWVAPDAHDGDEDRLATAAGEGQTRFESVAVRKDGTVIPTEVSARSVESDEGTLIVSVLRDISERKTDEERLVFLAFHDSLTRLPNRAALDDRLRAAIADARRHKDLLALAYIDLDRFKPINDRFGHEVGDQALVTIANRMSEAIREQDHVSRIGGDEFVVVLPRLRSTTELATVARRLLETIRRPIEACDNECHITASIGFAVFDERTDDARSLIVKADVAMYAAKGDPESPWLVWDESMGPSVLSRNHPD